MPRRQPQLAKLTRPRLHGAVARERLLELLDSAREHPIIWVYGPPGAGKTTLVASYIEQASSPAIWYQLDGSDADPATFFYYLAQAVIPFASPRRRPLPLLTPEYLSDLEGFSRRFFRNAFASLAPGSLLALDNYHEIAADSSLHRALNAAFGEVPESANVIVISRAQPPNVFARLQVADALAIVGWEQLQLSEEETAAIVAHRQINDPRLAASIHVQAGGWVAGVRLLLERLEPGVAVATLNRCEAPEVTFDYFAAEIFDRAPESLRQLLLKTAFLPRFTAAIAAAVSGDPHAGRQLEELYRRRLFIDRRVSHELTYQYHDLFRAFLLARAEQTLSPEEAAALSASAAELLLAAGLREDAFALFVRAQDWGRAEKVFVDSARSMIAQGRWQTLEDWSAVLPSERIARNPWVRYWLGRSKTFVDAGAARAMLEEAYQSFLDSADGIGQLLACAAIMDALYFEIRDFKAFHYWLEQLTRLLQAQTQPLDVDDDLWVHAMLMAAAGSCSPGNLTLPASIARVKELLPHCRDVNLKVIVANMLHYSGAHRLDAEAVAIATREAHPLLTSHELSADRSALYHLAEENSHLVFGRGREALACCDRADDVIERHGLAGRIPLAGLWRGFCELRGGDLQAAEASIARSEGALAGDQGFAGLILDHLKALVSFARGEREKAMALSLAALRRCEERALMPAQLIIHRLGVARMLIEGGRADQGREVLAAIESQREFIVAWHLAGTVALLKGWAAHKRGDESLRDTYLSKAMRLARDERERHRMCQSWYRLALEELVPIALVRAIETDTACGLIRDCHLSPPPHMPESWLWPVRVHTFGRFEVLVDDKLLEFGRKAPKRTIALLKAIIALGGRDVPEQCLCDALWPDLEGDAAREALAAALHRLRRLLGASDVIRQVEGTLSLNDQRCFVDAWAFEIGIERPGEERAALELYRGGFLEGDGEAPWSASMRERLRGRFVRALETIARELETVSQYEEAIDLYLRGIDADNLVEPFYQGLMRSYQKLGRGGEGISAYRRLRQTLSVTLGLQPGFESQRLFEELRRQ